MPWWIKAAEMPSETNRGARTPCENTTESQLPLADRAARNSGGAESKLGNDRQGKAQEAAVSGTSDGYPGDIVQGGEAGNER